MGEFVLSDHAHFYLSQVQRIAAADYLPSTQDVLRARVRTTGIVQTEFKVKNLKFVMYDMGGQRNERRKWIHAFDNVHAVVFVAALSEFDQALFEDEAQNRMEEALVLFDQIANSRWFSDAAMILFLNKKDLFAQKIASKNVSQYFSGFGGDDRDFDDTSAFFKEQFLSRVKNKNKTVYTHVTCATDTNNVKFVFNAVISLILERTLKESGMH